MFEQASDIEKVSGISTTVMMGKDLVRVEFQKIQSALLDH
jgi:hypothetical protein